MLQNRNDCFAAFFFSEKEIDKSVYKVYILIYTVKAQLKTGKTRNAGNRADMRRLGRRGGYAC